MGSKLIEGFKENSALNYLDAQTGRKHRLEDLLWDDLGQLSDKKSLAFLYVDNSIQSVAVLLNFLRSNHAIALLNPNVHDELKQKLESRYMPRFIFDPKREHFGHCKTERIRLPDGSLMRNVLDVDEYRIHPQVKVLLSTSGTTGSPKMVKLSEDNLMENARSILDYLPVDPRDVAPLNLPIHYAYGLSLLTTNSLQGGTIVCTNHYDVFDKTFWSQFKKYNYTTLAGVPYVYEMLNRIGFLKKDYPSLTYLTQAGGKLSKCLVRKFAEYAQKNDIRFYVMYGQTEASARMSYLDPGKALEKFGSIGKPISNGSFLLDPETSELIYEGPNVFGGYATSPADLESFDESNVLHTGDLAEIDNDGFYYIKGRIKRFVKLFGSRLNLDEIEGFLKRTFNGEPIAVTSIDDREILVGIEQGDISEAEIKSLLKEAFSIHPSFIAVTYHSQLPLTPNRKINYKRLVHHACNG